MNQEQIDVINITQEVMRSVVLSLLALNPDAMPTVAKGLLGSAQNPQLSPMARQMLEDLAAGVEMLASVAQSRRQ